MTSTIDLRAPFARLLSLHAEFFAIGRRTAWPLVDLLLRLWLAQAFFVSGVLKLGNWDTALFLAEHEYPVSWMDPVTAAWLGAGIEVVGGVLLGAGLMTRFAALPMLCLSLVIQYAYRPFDSQLLWAALFAWYVVAGAGPLSLDHALRGLADSALPGAARVGRFFSALSRTGIPLYLLLLRLWMAAALYLAAGEIVEPALRSALPVESPWHFGAGPALLIAVSLVAGVALRYAALTLLLTCGAAGMLGLHQAALPYWLMTIALLLAQGPGTLSIDAVIAHALRTRFPELEGKPAFSLGGLPRVVIVGAGFGGLACAAALRRVRASVTVIDRANFHLFQPLLYQVATASLSPGDVAAPLRPLFREAFNTQVLHGTVTGVDTARQQVLLGDRRIPYDFLVLATGATHSYFGRDEWQGYAPGLKRIEDATEIRRRLLVAFEKAEATEDDVERSALLTFLIVGAGPTGVELAGAIAELARHGMEKDFRRFDPASARIILVQSGPRVLPTFPESLSAIAQASLERLGIEVLTQSRVEMIDAEGVRVSGKRIEARTVLWAAGVVASPAARWLGVEADAAGRIKVGGDLSIQGLPTVFAIGDTAASHGWKSQPVPGLAPAAKQGGLHVARVIRARLEGAPAPAPFVYRHLGSLATIGRKAAVVDFGWIRLWGAPAWWLWGLVHVGLLVGVRNRVSTLLNWFWSYLTFGGGIRLITGAEPAPASPKVTELRKVVGA
jgi:NADH dehydrogenase/putative oxidoreductase